MVALEKQFPQRCFLKNKFFWQILPHPRDWYQARNQEFFRAGEFSGNMGTSIKHSPITQEGKAPQEKYIRIFRLETLKNCILNENFTHRWPQSGHFFLQISAILTNFWKRAGETGDQGEIFLLNWGNASWKRRSLNKILFSTNS